MLILSSYYLIYYLKNEEKLKFFKTWYYQLSQQYAIIYFEKIYNLIIEGVFEINDILSRSKNISDDAENITNPQKFFDKKETELNSIITFNKVIQKKIYDKISFLSGYQIFTKNYSNIEGTNKIDNGLIDKVIEKNKKLTKKKDNNEIK